MKRVTWTILILLLCTILTLTACRGPADPAEESSQLLSSEAVPQTETEMTSGTVHTSDIDLDSKPAESTAAVTESTEPVTTAAEPPEPDTTVPQSEPSKTPAETEKPAPVQPTEPKPTEPKPTEPKPTEHVHSWSDWTQTAAPTCSADGWQTRVCTGCGFSETRNIPATGNHSWQETAPTCTQEGAKTCKVCGKKETVPALGHDWVHSDEVGHWQNLITCRCGAQFSSTDDWYAHATASPDLDYADAHAGYELHQTWVVDTPAQDVCSRCGTVK